MKIVLDTNILIASALGNADAISIFNKIDKFGIEVFADSRLLHEYKVILNRKKFNFTDEVKNFILNWIENHATINNLDEYNIKFNPDRQDSKLLEIANFNNCDFIISEDKPLLNKAARFTNSQIITCKDFLDILENN